MQKVVWPLKSKVEKECVEVGVIDWFVVHQILIKEIGAHRPAINICLFINRHYNLSKWIRGVFTSCLKAWSISQQIRLVWIYVNTLIALWCGAKEVGKGHQEWAVLARLWSSLFAHSWPNHLKQPFFCMADVVVFHVGAASLSRLPDSPCVVVCINPTQSQKWMMALCVSTEHSYVKTFFVTFGSVYFFMLWKWSG